MRYRTSRLLDLVTFLNRGIAPLYLESGGLRVLNQKCIRHQSIFFNRARRTDHHRKKISPERLLRDGDILVNSTGHGTLGRVGQIWDLGEPTTVDSHITIVRPNSEAVDPYFLGLCLRSMESNIERLAEGSTGQTELPRTKLGEFEVPCPPRIVQETIGDIGKALDDKITLNRQTNVTLEAIAQALFKSWFIDFDPVRSKVEGQEPEGMDEATAALFPSEFVESELGSIPRGWSLSALSDHIEIERGLSYKGSGLRDAGQGMPMHNLNSVYEGGGYKYPGIKFYEGAYKDRHIALAGDIIVANTEQGHEHRLIGFPAIVPKRYSQGIYSHHIYRVRLRQGSPLTTKTVYYTLMSPSVREQIVGCTNGSTVNMLKPEGLQMPRFVCPSDMVADAFEKIVEPIHEAVEHNVEEMDKLVQIRDSLLLKLITGQLRIPEAERLVEATA